MATTNIPALERTVQETYRWLREIAGQLDSEDRNKGYHALRAVLHVTRDTMPTEEALHLVAQLPLLIKGIFLEGYHQGDKPQPKRHREDFLQAVRDRLEAEKQHDMDAELATMIVFAQLEKEISEGQWKQVKDTLHKEVQDLWLEPAAR